MIRPTISIKGKVSTNINIKGKVNASTIRIYPELENIEIVPTFEDQVVKPEKYGFEEVKVKGIDASIDEDIKPENIKEGAEILGVAGSFKGIDTSDATALSEDILVGKTAYVNNEKIEGTIQEYDGSNNIILEDKNGVILRTAKKHCKEDIQVNIDAKQITIKPSTEQQIQNGLFEEVVVSPVTSSIDENIKPEHIIEGIEILGVNGGFKGVDSSNATATAKDMLKNKTAYINNKEVQGEIETYDGGYTGNVETKNDLEISFISSIDDSLGLNIKKLPDKLTSIGKYAFYYSNIALTELPENVSSIGESAFGYCKKLSLTKLPDKLTSVGKNAFLECTKLKISEIPAGITKFTTYAFGYCSGLTSLTILGDVTEFAGQVFYSCGNLEKIVLPNITSVPILGNSVFSSTQIIRSGYIYVPDILVDEIKVAANWSEYANKIKPISELEV